MTLAVMQPYIFPYIGYFQLIHAVDTFIFYDDVNFIKKGWIHRNNILVNKEAHRFTIPCKEVSQNKLINEITVDTDTKVIEKFLKKIELAYKNAPFFDVVYDLISKVMTRYEGTQISELAASSIIHVCDYLGMEKRFMESSKAHGDSRGQDRQERLISISQLEEAQHYVNPIGGLELYEKADFEAVEIKLSFLKPDKIVYEQFENDFVPYLSIIDVLMFNDTSTVNKFLASYKLL